MRILLIDSHQIVRNGIRGLIAANRSWSVCGEASSGETALVVAAQTQPDLVVLDISVRGPGGFNLAALLRQAFPAIKLLIFTTGDDAESLVEAVAAGAKGYVMKSESDHHLIAAMTALEAGRSYFSPEIVERVTDIATNNEDGHFRFTPRELQVIDLISKGLSNRAIAKALGIAGKTIESHRASALRKAGVHTGPELVRYAFRRKLIAVGE